MKEGRIIILSAPSGTGKTTILQRVMEQLEGVSFSVSHTTRPPREGERDGVSYHFVSHDTFACMIEDGEFLEYAEVHGNYYGTSKGAVQQQVAQGVDVILDIDVQGARILRDEKGIDGTSIFLAPPDIDELERRLRGRGLDAEQTIAIRLANARIEMQAADEYQYLVINDVLDDAVCMLQAIILAERARGRRGIRGESLKILMP